MTAYALLLLPSANRVYTAAVDALGAAELACLAPELALDTIRTEEIAGVRYLCFEGPDDPAGLPRPLAAHSAAYALFRRDGRALHPVPLHRPDRFDDDLVTIPKYPGKTNEQFTRLLVNVTTAAITERRPDRVPVVLDPMCGRGTTLSTAWTLGLDAAGVEADAKAVELYGAFLRTYLRRKRLKHTVDTAPVRREGRSLGTRLDATVRPEYNPHGGPDRLSLSIFTGDTRQSAALWGKRRFDTVVCDAPYGVVHGSARRDRSGAGSAGRDRSPAELLSEALPVWVSQLRPGGALGLSWNTVGLPRERMIEMIMDAGASPLDDGPWTRFGHRVDASIHRDLVVAIRTMVTSASR